MHSKLTEITYEIELKSGEALRLPKDAPEILGPGHWVVSIRPADQGPHQQALHDSPLRDHTAFLNSFTPEDEGLYDDYSAG